MRSFVSAIALFFLLATPAYAFHCPADIAQIDAALPNAELSEEEQAMVIELRNQGEDMHNAGQHQEAVDTLAQAKEILGIE
ncbi:MAG TPA: hypothetical protein VKN76_02790 [Kiloniellaceae bacterium]|nr:hypothetical protein [Kiloniellaceae bacterium]